MGDNVLILRLPRHGMADRKVENLSPLKAEELRDCADTSVDIACGLGQKVYVCGLSAGGTLAAWIVQNRSEVTRAVLIAPALGFSWREGTRLQKAMALLLPRACGLVLFLRASDAVLFLRASCVSPESAGSARDCCGTRAPRPAAVDCLRAAELAVPATAVTPSFAGR